MKANILIKFFLLKSLQVSIFTSKIILLVKEDHSGLDSFSHYGYKVNAP